MAVTADCRDPAFNADNFVVETVTQASLPAPHTKVMAHFTATATTPEYKVTLYLPPAARWQGRFFQHAYPLEQPENLDDVAFALANGGYLVNVRGTPCGCGGYRPDAAAAKLARDYARRFYDTSNRIHGYLWGGSGGAFLTIGAAENTVGVWDGVVPYVMPNAGSVLNANSIGALAGLALRDKLPAISEAIKPGGSGDPYAGLSEEERAILGEALRMGVPLRTFEQGGIGGAILMFLSGGVKENDPSYVEDFWTKPGYEGSNPPPYLQRAKVDQLADVAAVGKDASGAITGVKLAMAPALGPTGPVGLEFWVYAPDGKTKVGELGGQLKGDTIVLSQPGPPSTAGKLGSGLSDASRGSSGSAAGDLLWRLDKGYKVRVNNLFYLALHYYHRHAMPADRDFYAYDQFRNADGSPRYPQRSYVGATEQAVGSGGGGTQTGRIETKMIVLQSMIDGGAMPWMADVYSKRVRRVLGEAAYQQNFRLWFNDNAEHLDIPPRGPSASRIINYVPSLYQSVRDLVAWSERGVAPPQSSRYTVKDAQVQLAARAGDRRGIQPVVDLTVGGGKRIEVAANQPVAFTGRIEAPSGVGKVVGSGWWFGEGEPEFSASPLAQPTAATTVTATHAYTKPGTYYVTLFATSQREGDPNARTTAVQNLDRVRVVVR